MSGEIPPAPSVAAPADEPGLAREFAPYLSERPGQSAFALLQHGPAALLARAVLADLATATLDVQYYLYEGDLTGALLTQRLLDAADRGVHVRILLDDNNPRGSDEALKLLASHPQVEVRVFNPYRIRARWLRPLELALRFRQLQRRMHNKLFLVDGVAGIFGGRNIGNNYFDADDHANFADFDVFVAGRLVEQARDSFGAYWNHRLAVPAEVLTSAAITPAQFAAARAGLSRRLEQAGVLEERYERARATLVEIMEDPDAALTWAEAEFVADPPGKLDPGHDDGSPVLDRLVALWEQARQEMLIESAYFVPSRRGAEFIVRQVGEGVHTRLLTNSLAANDVTVVHVGYAKYRRKLLKAGVQLYEFQQRAAAGGEELTIVARRRRNASLHAKVAVADRELTWIGSFNLDPRSAMLNSELAIVIHSPKLAEEAARLIERDLEPDRAWSVTLERRRTGGREMVWRGQRDGRMVRESREPDATLRQRLVVNTVKWLPGIEWLL